MAKTPEKNDASCDYHSMGQTKGGHPFPPHHPHGCGHRSWMHLLVKLSFTALILLLAIAVGTQIWGRSWNENIRAEVTVAPYSRSITVEGDGKVTVKPDIARISLSVATTGKTVKQVTEEGNSSMNAVIAAMKALGIKDADIKTSSYNLYPEYNYTRQPSFLDQEDVPEKAEPRIVGYKLSQSLEVKVRDLTITDKVVDDATTAGANQVGSLTFDVDDLAPVKAEARKLAFDKAKDKASQMAGAAGVNLGRVVTFSEGYSGGYMTQYARNFAVSEISMMDSPAASGIESGSMDVTVNVSVTYEIE